MEVSGMQEEVGRQMGRKLRKWREDATSQIDKLAAARKP
jgi:hypothetical protein